MSWHDDYCWSWKDVTVQLPLNHRPTEEADRVAAGCQWHGRIPPVLIVRNASGFIGYLAMWTSGRNAALTSPWIKNTFLHYDMPKQAISTDPNQPVSTTILSSVRSLRCFRHIIATLLYMLRTTSCLIYSNVLNYFVPCLHYFVSPADLLQHACMWY